MDSRKIFIVSFLFPALLFPQAGNVGMPRKPGVWIDNGTSISYPRRTLALTSTLTAPNIQLVPESYGAVGNSSTDDAPAINAMIVAATYASIRSKPMGLSPGKTYRVASPIIFDSKARMVFDGNGSTLICDVGITNPCLYLKDLQDSIIQNVFLNTNQFQPMDAGVWFENGSGSLVVPTGNTLSNVIINCTAPGGCNYGVRWKAGGTGNNDMSTVINSRVANYSNAAFQIDGSQSVGHLFINNACNGNATGQYCVQSVNGNFHWIGGGGGGNTIADFEIQNPNREIDITGFDSEDSARLLETTSLGGALWPVSISNCRYAANALNADGYGIVYSQRGPLHVFGNTFDAGGLPKININFNGAPGTADIEDNSWGATNTSTVNLLNVASPLAGSFIIFKGNMCIASVGVTAPCNGVPSSYWSGTGNVKFDGALTAGGFIDSGTKFTTSGCSISSTTGGATSGKFTLGANTCTAVVTLNGATGLTSANGWACQASDQTAPTVLIALSASSTTTASFNIPAGAGATDVISFSCRGY